MDRVNVYRFKKSEHEQIRFDIREYKNTFYLDIRLWFNAGDGGTGGDEDRYVPSKKGLCINIAHLREVCAGVDAINDWVTCQEREATYRDSNFDLTGQSR